VFRQVFDLLVYLVQNRDRVVSKDDLIASVWGGRSVSDSTLTSRINAARNAVGDSGADKKLIRTIARKGLRFVGEVRTQPTDTEPADASGLPPDQVHERSRPALPPPERGGNRYVRPTTTASHSDSTKTYRISLAALGP
jgi:DNA-binding winged helix-turn-helix (wHTH) protein